LLRRGAPMQRGGDHDRWDVETRGGMLGRVRLRTEVEEHGGGRQLARFRLLPAPSGLAACLGSIAIGLAAYAAIASSPVAAAAFLCVALLVAGRLLLELASGASLLTAAIADHSARESSERP
jgi:O-antigen biosynthesis protein